MSNVIGVIGATVNKDGTFDLTVNVGTVISVIQNIRLENITTNNNGKSITIKGILKR
jgi:hypothetical protein